MQSLSETNCLMFHFYVKSVYICSLCCNYGVKFQIYVANEWVYVHRLGMSLTFYECHLIFTLSTIVTQQHSKIQSIQKCTNPNFRAHGLSRCFHSFFDFSGNLRLLWGLNYNINFHDAHILQTSQKEEGATIIIFSMFFSISGNTTITGVRHRGRGKNNQ